MKRYIGIDPHKDSCTVAVVGPSGKKLRSQVVETNGEALVAAIGTIPGQKHLCIEEGQFSSWLYEVLSPLTAETVVAVAPRSRGNKNDAADAFGLAELLRLGKVEQAVYKAPGRYCELRELARVYAMVVKDVTRCRNRLKSIYRSRGIDVSGEEVYRRDAQPSYLEQLPESAREAATILWSELEPLLSLHKQAERALLREARRYPIARVLQSCPGLGPIRVAQLIPIVVTPHRFRTVRQFWSYSGLGIVMRSSSDWVPAGGGCWVRDRVQHTRGLNRNHHHRLKAIFKGAAMTVTMQATPTPFKSAYERLLREGTKPNLAQLTVARKIAATVLRMWKEEASYDPER